MLLLSFPPNIGLAWVVGLGIEIGWEVVGRVRMWCLLWSVGVGVVEVCILWLWHRCGLGMRGVCSVFLWFVELCDGGRIL